MAISLKHKNRLESIPHILQNIYKKNTGDYTILFNPYSYKGIFLINKDLYTALKRVINGKNTFRQCAFLINKTIKNINSSSLFIIMKKLEEYDIINNISSVNQINYKPNQNKPLVFWIDITNQCNFRCTYCFVDKKKEIIDPEKFEIFLNHIIKLKQSYKFTELTFVLAGGEPLIYFDTLKKIINLINNFSVQYKIKTQIRIITNGSLLTDDKALYLKKTGVLIGISLDGLGKYNNFTRKLINGKGTFHLAERGINIALKHKIILNVIVTVTNSNLSNLPSLVKYLLKKRIRIRLQFYRKTNEFCNDDIVVSSKNISKYYKNTLKIIYKYYQDNNNFNSPTINNSLLDRLTYPCIPSPRNCAAGNYYFCLSPKCRIRICPSSTSEIPFDKTGDFIKTINEIDKKIINYSVDNIEICKTCQWKYICQAGCRLERLFIHKNLNNISIKCDFYKKILPYIILLEAKRIIGMNLYNKIHT